MRGTFYLSHFGFHDPGNIDIDVTFNFLSIIFAEVLDIENIHVSHFENGCHSPHRSNPVGVPFETRFLGIS